MTPCMLNKQNAVVAVTSHSQQIGQPPCLALTDLWTSNVWNASIQVTKMGVFFSFQENLFEANQV